MPKLRKNIMKKYASRGIATRTTSRGRLTIWSPCRENMITIVKSNPIRARGLIFGAKTLSYHSLPFLRASRYQLATPAAKGIPRKMSTFFAMSAIVMFITAPCAEEAMTGVMTVMKK